MLNISAIDSMRISLRSRARFSALQAKGCVSSLIASISR